MPVDCETASLLGERSRNLIACCLGPAAHDPLL